MKVIVWTNNEGRLQVTYPATRKGEKEEDAIQRAMGRAVPEDAKDVLIIDHSEVPQDRTFRDAWTHGGVFGVDMDKAKGIHREKLRRLRKPKMEALDVEALRNLSNPAKLTEIEGRKQELRDATAYPTINAATTPDQLKAAIPPCLA